ncbi:hypothetical protein [Marinifilum fragile]|uniref:hypothetical protein n=1 Tax=Marinifilum fragile TaxID=570161 RepID=UPI002AABA6AD|nr:hypothetical protein [Marinifilum fragile]
MDSIISFIAGGILSVLVGWIFYKKSNKKKSLIPYLDYFSKLFDSVEPDLKKDLKILYKENEIEQLYSVQFTIDNNGSKPIRDIIEPLTISIPSELEIMDAYISDIVPQGRTVDLKHRIPTNDIIINFPLLNQKEFFVVKILFKGDVIKYLNEKHKDKYKYYDEDENVRYRKVNEKDIIDCFELKLSVDELPPTLNIKKESRNGSENENNDSFENIFHLTLGVAVGYILWSFTKDSPDNFIFNYNEFFTGFWSWFYKFNYFKLSLLITWLVPIYFAIKGFVLTSVIVVKKVNIWLQ